MSDGLVSSNIDICNPAGKWVEEHHVDGLVAGGRREERRWFSWNFSTISVSGGLCFITSFPDLPHSSF